MTEEPNREILPRAARKYIYDLALAVLPLLAALGLISDEMIPLIVAIIGALLAVGTARTHLTPIEQ